MDELINRTGPFNVSLYQGVDWERVYSESLWKIDINQLKIRPVFFKKMIGFESKLSISHLHYPCTDRLVIIYSITSKNLTI